MRLRFVCLGKAFSARGWPQSEQISMVLVRPTLVTMRQPHFVQDMTAAPPNSINADQAP